MKIIELLNSPSARPTELGEAYFYVNGQLVDISPERNHRDWLLAHQSELGLPDHVQQDQKKALWEAYKQHMIRIVWDKGAQWRTGVAHGQGNVLYLNGFDRDVWSHMKSILNEPIWVGQVDTVVVEYVQDKQGKPNWYHTDIFKGGDVESLYRGKRPRRERAPPDAIYGGEPGVEMVKEMNHHMNQLNDLADDVFEMFDQHVMAAGHYTQLHAHSDKPWLTAKDATFLD